MQHANDNRSPAEHRAIVAEQAAGQGDGEVRNRNRNWPTFGRLKRAKRWRDIRALERFAEDEGLSRPYGLLGAANDNSPAFDADADAGDNRLVDGRLDEENPTADEIAAAAWADDEDRKAGHPELATRIQFGAHGHIVAVKVRGRYRGLEETFFVPRGAGDEGTGAGRRFAMLNDVPDAEGDMARRIDHDAMKRRLGDETTKLVELACGDTTSAEIGEMYGRAGKTAERYGVEMVDAAIAKLMAAYAARDAADMAA